MSKAEKIEGWVLGMFPVEWALTIGMLALLGTMVWLAAKQDHVDCKTGCAVPVIPGAKPWKAGW